MSCDIAHTLRLLLKFIDIDEYFQVNADKMLSKACFQAWLNLKSVRPKHPEEAFRKTITAHAQGTQGMQPFPPEVERSVLEIIRQPKIWPCFKNTCHRIGERGFTKEGFWEQQNVNTGISLLPRIIPVYKKPINFKTIFIEVNFTLIWSKFCHVFKQKEIENLINFYNKLVTTNTNNSERLLNFFKQKYNDLNLNLIQLYGFILNYLNTYLLDENKKNINYFPFCKETNYFCSYEFQIPCPHEQKFHKNRKIGTLIDDPTSKCCSTVDMDDICRDIYGGSIIGLSCLSSHVFKSNWYFYQEDIFNEILRKGEAWNRTIEYKRNNGDLIVFLNRYYLKENYNNVIFIQMQDITDIYQNKLSQLKL